MISNRFSWFSSWLIRPYSLLQAQHDLNRLVQIKRHFKQFFKQSDQKHSSRSWIKMILNQNVLCQVDFIILPSTSGAGALKNQTLWPKPVQQGWYKVNTWPLKCSKVCITTTVASKSDIVMEIVSLILCKAVCASLWKFQVCVLSIHAL